jgi:hypothetical protein
LSQGIFSHHFFTLPSLSNQHLSRSSLRTIFISTPLHRHSTDLTISHRLDSLETLLHHHYNITSSSQWKAVAVTTKAFYTIKRHHLVSDSFDLKQHQQQSQEAIDTITIPPITTVNMGRGGYN